MLMMARPRRDVQDEGLKAVFAELDRRAALKKEPSNQAEFAKAIGVTRQAITGWNEVPVTRVLDVESVLGISRKILRPDVFGPRSPTTRKARK